MSKYELRYEPKQMFHKASNSYYKHAPKRRKVVTVEDCVTSREVGLFDHLEANPKCPVIKQGRTILVRL